MDTPSSDGRSHFNPRGTPDDIRQYLFRDIRGELDGAYTFNPHEAAERATALELRVVVREWKYLGEHTYSNPHEYAISADEMRQAMTGSEHANGGGDGVVGDEEINGTSNKEKAA